MTSKAEIKDWFDVAKKAGATHMIVVCDSFDHDDYPVSVLPGEDVRAKVARYSGKEMQSVMEVYSMAVDRDLQLAEHRSFHYETATRVLAPVGEAAAIQAVAEKLISKRPKPFGGPYVLLVREKDSDHYFHVPDEPTLHAVALDILGARLESRHWYPVPGDPPEAPDYVTNEEIATLRGAIQAQAQKIVTVYRHALATYRDRRADYDRIVEAVKDKNGRGAWQILEEHAYYEYQYVELLPYCSKYRG